MKTQPVEFVEKAELSGPTIAEQFAAKMEEVKTLLKPEVDKAQVIPTGEQAHLGGYVHGGDAATWYPDLWKWLVNKLSIKRVIDVGCGEGQALEYFRQLGCDVVGIDGMPQNDPDIIECDFSKGSVQITDPYDLVWCCEFVEHVVEEKMRNYLNVFASAQYIAMTHATPGQPGHHHVNCQTEDYWRGAMAVAGFQLDPVLTKMARLAASVNANPWNHFKRSGLVFKRL